MKIEYALIIILIIVIIIGVCGKVFTDGLSGDCYAELLMPGNTIVTGECTGINRLSNGWMRVKINGKWFTCNEWRVVIRERD